MWPGEKRFYFLVAVDDVNKIVSYFQCLRHQGKMTYPKIILGYTYKSKINLDLNILMSLIGQNATLNNQTAWHTAFFIHW